MRTILPLKEIYLFILGMLVLPSLAISQIQIGGEQEDSFISNEKIEQARKFHITSISVQDAQMVNGSRSSAWYEAYSFHFDHRADSATLIRWLVADSTGRVDTVIGVTNAQVRLIEAHTKDSIVERYKYDPQGNLLRKYYTSRNSDEELSAYAFTSYSYDSKNRRIRKELIAPTIAVIENYRYDEIGNKIEQESRTIGRSTSDNKEETRSYLKQAITYDSLGNPIAVTYTSLSSEPERDSLYNSCDALGVLRKVEYFSGKPLRLRRVYRFDHKPSAVRSNKKGYPEYDLTSIQEAPSNSSTLFTYNELGLISEIRSKYMENKGKKGKEKTRESITRYVYTYQ